MSEAEVVIDDLANLASQRVVCELRRTVALVDDDVEAQWLIVMRVLGATIGACGAILARRGGIDPNALSPKDRVGYCRRVADEMVEAIEGGCRG